MGIIGKAQEFRSVSLPWVLVPMNLTGALLPTTASGPET